MPTPHPLIEVHEDRITRLEENVTDCRVELGVLKEQLASGIELLSQKMDGVSQVEARVGAIEQHHEVEAEILARMHDRRVKILKAGGLLVSACGAVFGILMKLLGE